MAHSIISLFTVVAVVIGYSIGLGSALRLDISPESFNTMVTDQLDLTCISNAPAWIRSIETLGILKKGDHPIAVINSKGLAMGDKWKDNVQAQGNLTKDVVNSFLKLSIKNPGEEETGTYVCQMYYHDENLQMHEMKAEANVTIENEDITVIVEHLLQKIRTMEKNEKSMQEEVTKLKETISTQKVQLAEQDAILMEQKKELNEQKKENEKVSSRIDLLEDMEKKQDKSMKASIDKVSSRIEFLEDLENNHSQLMKDSIKKVTENIGLLQNQSSRFQEYMDLSPVAFSYSYTHNENTKIIEGQPVLFTNRIMDLGGHFNPSTGIFTAPMKGMYVFHLVVTSWHNDAQADVDLKSGKQTIATLFSYDKDYWDQSSVSTAVVLDRGQDVKVVVRYMDKDAINPNPHHSYFTGYLLKPI